MINDITLYEISYDLCIDSTGNNFYREFLNLQYIRDTDLDGLTIQNNDIFEIVESPSIPFWIL
jgi:hypothetical protein